MKNLIYPSSVAQAAEILDKVLPGWYNDINTEILKMNSNQDCILGQLYGIAWKGHKAIFGHTNFQHGVFSQKGEEWLAQINYRKSFNCSYKISTKNERLVVEYTDGFRERFNSELDIPVGVKYKVVLN